MIPAGGERLAILTGTALGLKALTQAPDEGMRRATEQSTRYPRSLSRSRPWTGMGRCSIRTGPVLSLSSLEARGMAVYASELSCKRSDPPLDLPSMASGSRQSMPG